MAVPKYRYFLVAPETIRITPEDFLAELPAGAWVGAERDRSRSVAVPGTEVLQKNFPRIRFERLRELMPGCIQPVAGAPEWISLRTEQLVLAYQPETRREELPPDPEPQPAPEAAKEDVPEKTDAQPAEPAAEAQKSGTAPEPPATDEPEPKPEVSAGTPPKPVPAWKRILKPKLAPPPQTDARETKVEEPPKPPLAARAISAEDEKVLRGLLMTDDELTVGRVLDLCAKLPGVTGCELLVGDKVEHAATMPATLKPSAWISPAREALEKMEGIPAARPVLTLHPEGMGLSMWLPKKFTLLIAHDERGFPPGVREKIAAAAAAIEKAAD